MTDIEQLERKVKADEGFRAHPYKDTRGFYTFGYGRCLETNPLTAEEYRYLLNNGHLSLAIDESGAEWLMFRELNACESALERMLPFWPALNPARQNVLVEMGFQLGLTKLVKFRQMMAALAVGDYGKAAAEALDSDWAEQTPNRAHALAAQLRDGVFPGQIKT